MSKFMVRVLLHEADSAALYAVLDAAMVKRGFVTDLPGKKASYVLPTGNYWYEGKTTPNDLRVIAAAAAESTGQDFGIVVVRANGWSVMRLKKAEPAAQD
jgi:hypothetical protein